MLYHRQNKSAMRKEAELLEKPVILKNVLR